MPISLRPAVPDDYVRMAQVFCDAFAQDVMTLALFPRELRQTDAQVPADWLRFRMWRIQTTAARETTRMYVAVDDALPSEDGANIVGWAQWEVPDPSPIVEETPEAKAEKKAKQKAVLAEIPSLSPDELDSLFASINQGDIDVLGPRGHRDIWYLGVLTVDPKQQRRGIGKLLINHGLELCDKEGLDNYVIASPAGAPLYTSVGYREIGRHMFGGANPQPYLMMLRPSPKAKAS